MPRAALQQVAPPQMGMPPATSALTNGYSLFELIIILALFSCIVTLSMPFLRIADAQMVHQELERLSAVITFMQRKALLEGRAAAIRFDLTKNCYNADTCHRLSQGVVFGAPSHVLGPPSQPVTALAQPITFPEQTLTCYPDGTISSGTVYLTDAHKDCCYALTCDASAVTRVRRYRYDGRWSAL